MKPILQPEYITPKNKPYALLDAIMSAIEIPKAPKWIPVDLLQNMLNKSNKNLDIKLPRSKEYEIIQIQGPNGNNFELAKYKVGKKEYITHPIFWNKLNQANERFKSAFGADIFDYITSFYRSPEEQMRLMDLYNSGSPEVVYKPAQPFSSMHNFGLAIDVAKNRMNTEMFKNLVNIMEGLGFRWGGRFADSVHFDLPEMKEFVNLVKKGKKDKK